MGITVDTSALCFCVAWVLLALLAWNLWRFLHDSWEIARRMHQIPCSQCRFFSGDYRLKCSLHPDWAATEAAIHCPDYGGE
ncbi:hypothetical protein RYO59_001937 [Thermosynechococcaceae cyanobacterium Okahandja]